VGGLALTFWAEGGGYFMLHFLVPADGGSMEPIEPPLAYRIVLNELRTNNNAQ